MSVVVITGAGGGFGRSLAEMTAARGARVVASDVDGAVCQAFGVYLPRQNMALRGLFIIDPNGVLLTVNIQDLLQQSHGMNVGLRYLDGAFNFDARAAGERNRRASIVAEARAGMPNRARLIGWRRDNPAQDSRGHRIGFQLRLGGLVRCFQVAKNFASSPLLGASAASPLPSPDPSASLAYDPEPAVPKRSHPWPNGSEARYWIACPSKSRYVR